MVEQSAIAWSKGVRPVVEIGQQAMRGLPKRFTSGERLWAVRKNRACSICL